MGLDPADIKPNTEAAVKPAEHEGLAKQAWDWTDNNVFRPAINDAILQPYSAIRNVVNFVTNPFKNDLLPDVAYLRCEAPTSTAARITQGLSAGLATALILRGVGKAADGLTGMAGETALGAELAARPMVAPLTGIGLYEGLRDPDLNLGETRLGNTVGTVGAVGAFGTVYGLTGAESFMGRMGARFLAGSVAMPVGLVVGDAVQGTTPTGDQLLQSTLYGGFLSAAMPGGKSTRAQETVLEKPAHAENPAEPPAAAQTAPDNQGVLKLSDYRKAAAEPAQTAPGESRIGNGTVVEFPNEARAIPLMITEQEIEKFPPEQQLKIRAEIKRMEETNRPREYLLLGDDGKVIYDDIRHMEAMMTGTDPDSDLRQ